MGEGAADPGGRDRRIDGPLGRGVALLLFLGILGMIGWLHGESLFPPDPVASELAAGGNEALALCIAKRAGDIDQMLADGTIDENQAGLFKQRAEALCQAQEGGGAGPPQ